MKYEPSLGKLQREEADVIQSKAKLVIETSVTCFLYVNYIKCLFQKIRILNFVYPAFRMQDHRIFSANHAFIDLVVCGSTKELCMLRRCVLFFGKFKNEI